MSRPTSPSLVLASTSAYRKELLNRLGVAFDVVAPEVDETPGAHESTIELARRLPLAKAMAVARRRSAVVA